MKNVDRAAAIRGKTLRFIWTEGPTQGRPHAIASSAAIHCDSCHEPKRKAWEAR